MVLHVWPFFILSIEVPISPNKQQYLKWFIRNPPKRALQKGPFLKLCEDCDWRGWRLPTAGGKEDRERERKKELRMTEHESRKCNERRSGFCFAIFNKYKGSLCRRWIKTKISVVCQAKGYPMACIFQKTNSCFWKSKGIVFYPKRSIQADPRLRLLFYVWLGRRRRA